jgi:N-acetylglucosamine kinase-like BadF-type ATPase
VPFFLGIDGGGSSTRCTVGDEHQILGTGSAAGCNVLRVGEDCAQTSLEAAIHEACVKAEISPHKIVGTCAGVAGAQRPGIAAIMRRILSNVVSGQIEITGDSEIALEAAFGSGRGVIVISGTGSIAYGRNSQGKTARAGGWGHAISDEGSGHWIAVAAIRASLRARDRGEHSGLLHDLMDALGVNTVEELIERVNASPAPDFAALFPVVLSVAMVPRLQSAADADDDIATQVLQHAGKELAKLAETVIHRLFTAEDEVRVATHGGVLTSSEQVRASFAEYLQSLCSRVSYAAKTIDPPQGALDRARRGFASAATGQGN